MKLEANQQLTPLIGHKRYLIDKEGNVYSLKSNKFLAQQYTKDGYKRIKLFENGETETYLVHRLVAKTFINNPKKPSRS